MSAVGARRERIPASIVVVTATAWIVSIAAEASGRAALLGHGNLIEGGLPTFAALALFVLAWQVMLAAMMLPSSVSMLRAFDRIVATRPGRASARASFIGAYVAAWTAFGIVAFLGDSVVHRTVDSTPWLQAHEWLIGAVVLIGAGAFQFSRLKDRCLTECRTPVGFLMERYRPGAAAAFRTGVSHAVFCIGCCWALMLVAFAAGAGNLVWMAIVTTVMVIERTVSWGAAIVRPVGGWLILLGVLMLWHPLGVSFLGVG